MSTYKKYSSADNNLEVLGVKASSDEVEVILYSQLNNNMIITYENYEIDTSKREVKDNGMEVKLTTLEFDLLMLFINNKNRSFSREEVLKNVWGDDYFGSDRVVDDLVRRLRKKMPLLDINTIYGYGYRLL